MLDLEALHKEVKPLGFLISRAKTKVWALQGSLNEAVECLHAYDKNTEILEKFAYLSMVHRRGGSCQEALRQSVLAYFVMNSLNTSIWHCQYLWRKTKISIFKSLMLPAFVKGILKNNLERWINAFSTMYLHRIMTCYWNNCVKWAITPWDWFEAYYLHGSSIPTLAK